MDPSPSCQRPCSTAVHSASAGHLVPPGQSLFPRHHKLLSPPPNAITSTTNKKRPSNAARSSSVNPRALKSPAQPPPLPTPSASVTQQLLRPPHLSRHTQKRRRSNYSVHHAFAVTHRRASPACIATHGCNTLAKPGVTGGHAIGDCHEDGSAHSRTTAGSHGERTPVVTKSLALGMGEVCR